MTLAESFLLALALCVDSLTVSAASALKSRMPIRSGLLMAFIFGFFQGLFPLLGALLGSAFQSVAESVDHWVAFGLLLAVGGKMIWDAFRGSEDEARAGVVGVGTMCLLGIATSIDAFVVGIGFGMGSTLPQILTIALVIFAVTVVMSAVGFFLGRRSIAVPERTAAVLAGLVLIGLGVYTLLEHLVL